MDEKNSNIYLLEEMKLLRQEIETLSKRNNDDKNFCLISTAAFWSWYTTLNLTNSSGKASVAAIPLIVTMFFYLRERSTKPAIKKISDYIIHIEASFFLPNGLGWESHLSQIRKNTKNKSYIRTIEGQFWGGLSIINLFALFIFGIFS